MLLIGSGRDIGLYDNCDQRSDGGWTCFPGAYAGPDGTTKRTEETQKYLGGTYEFRVLEVEAFQITFK